jgi:orotate phosphoribosyltransferase
MATVAIARPPSKEGTQLHANRSAERATLETSTSALLEIVRARSFKTGKFKLSSGKESNLYFNMKPTMMEPRGAELSARAFLEIAHHLGIEDVSGLEMGAVPVIGAMTAISSVDDRPIRATFVRKQPKGHGTNDVIEGLGPNETLERRNVLVVDDVATSGGSILRAIERVREVGGIVNHAACLVERKEGARELLADHGVELHSVFTAADFAIAT